MGRTITDQEIALIKGMLARGMKNADIQFFFNRPGRRVNSGRISTIAGGTYSNSSSIPAATDEELNAFLDAHSPAADVPAVTLNSVSGSSDPASEAVLRAMFTRDAAGDWRLKAGETDRTECKQSFSLRNAAPWLRAVAALANNRGGYVFFGVADKDAAGVCKVVGLVSDEFRNADPGEIAGRLRSAFEPTPRFQKIRIELDGRSVGVLHIDQHESRPIIATKNEGGGGEIKEGDVFYRYPGTSRRISYGDLRAIMDERDARTRDSLMPMVRRLLELGPERAMIADLADGKLTDGKTSIELSEEIIEHLALVKEGEFPEHSGSTAFRLIGDVRAAAPISVKKGIITRDDMRRAFLSDMLNADALDYLRLAVEVPGSDWLPLRYFAAKAGMSRADLLSFIETSPGPQRQKALCRERLSSVDKAYTEAKGPPLVFRKRLEAGEEIPLKDARAVRHTAQAIQGLARPLRIEPARLKLILLRCLEIATESDEQFTRSTVRRAIARLDELMSTW